MTAALLPGSTASPDVFNNSIVLRTQGAFETTDEEFFAFCQRNSEWRIEQNAVGDWIIMAPAGGETGSRNNEIARQLGNWAKGNATGVAFDSSTGFVLPTGAKRSPDATWVRRTRLSTLTPEQKQKFLPLCPDFVIELRSPSDSLSPLQEKMAEYRDSGAHLGWLLDTAAQAVFVYRPGQETQRLDAPNTLSGSPELPGFVMDLTDVWNPGF